jgi:tetratricopeptide (TPR) repeat protein
MKDRAMQYDTEGVNFANLGRYEEAVASYDRAIAINPDYVDAWHNRGNALFRLNRKKEAVASYDKAIAINPDYVDAWNNRGVALHDLRRYEEAVASYDKAIAINPDYVDAWHNRGNALFRLNRKKEAVASYDKAIATNPDYVDAWKNRGVALQDLGRYEEAVASYDRVIAINPDYVDAWHNRGNALFHLNRKKEAVASHDRAIVINPDYVESWHNRGVALQDLGRYEEAVASYDRAIAINPDYIDAWNYRGIVLNYLGRYEEAVASSDKAFAINQQNREREDRKTLIQRIAETEIFGVLPSPIIDATQHPEALQYPDEVITLIRQLDEFLATARPQINLVLSCKQIPLSTWEKEKISITNQGSAHAKNVTFEFPDDLEIRRIKTVDVLAKETKQIEIPIIAKVKGILPLDITVKYHDSRDKSYSDTFDFDVEVIETETTAKRKNNAFESGAPIKLHQENSNAYAQSNTDTDNTGKSFYLSSKKVLTHHDIFITYSNKDKPIADAVCASLESHSIRCWIAPRDVLPGEDFPKAIIKAINGSKIMVLIFSAYSNESPHVTRELTKAVSNGVIIIPFRIEDVPLSESMEYLIGLPHWLDAFTPPLENHIDKLIKTVDAILNKRE